MLDLVQAEIWSKDLPVPVQGEKTQFTHLKKGKLHLSIFPLQPSVLECEGGDLTQIP